MDDRTIKQRVISGFAWEGSTKFIVQLISWATTIAVARILLPSDYGLMAVAMVVIQILTIITSCGLSEGLVNKTAITTHDQDGIFWVSLLLGCLMYTALYFLAPVIASIYQMETLTQIVHVTGIVLIFSALKIVPVSLALRNMDFRYRSIVEMVANLAMSATVLLLALAGFGVWSLAWAIIARHAIEVLAYLPLLKRIPNFILKLRELWSVIVFGMKFMASSLLEFLILSSDVLIIGLFSSQKIVGYYSMGFQLATIPLDKFGSVFNRIIFPALSRVKNNRAQAKILFLQMHRYLITFAYPVLIGLVMVAEDAVVFLLTEKWKPIVPVLQVLCAVNLLRVSGMIMLNVLLGLGNVNRVLVFHVLSLLVLPLAFFIGAQWGMIGVVYAWIIAYPPLYLFLAYSVLRELDLRVSDFFASARSTLVGSAVMLVAVQGFSFLMVDIALLFRLILYLLVGAVAYMSVFVLFYRDELAQVKRGWALLRARE